MKVHLEVPARPVALVTGVGRKRGIGAGIGRRLVSLGWDLPLTHRSAYDKRMPWGRGGDETGEVVEELKRRRKRFISIEADLETTSAAELIFRVVKKTTWSRHGPGLIAPRIG